MKDWKCVFELISWLCLFQLKESNLIGVLNKAQFLMSVMRNFRDKVRQLGSQVALSQPLINGPSKDKLTEILDRTGYPMEVTTGQRKYGGPPPDWEGPITGPAGPGHEVILPHFFRMWTFFC